MRMEQGATLSKSIVSLSYDGTQLCHAETVLPQLDSFSLKGTFFADPLPLLDSLPLWRGAVENEHEIGNGCLIGTMGALDSWSPEMIEDDIEETDSMLQELFPGQTVYSFGYPWATGGAFGIGHLRKIVEKHHSVCRSGEQGTNAAHEADLAYVRCMSMDGASATEMIEVVRNSVRQGHWLVLAFDGVGSGDPAVDAKAHFELCAWLSDNRELLDVHTVSAAADMVHRGSKAKLRLL